MVFIEAILFALSSGLLFHEKFRNNKPLFFLAGAIALVSSYLLFEEMASRLIRKELESAKAPPPTTATLPPATATPPPMPPTAGTTPQPTSRAHDPCEAVQAHWKEALGIGTPDAVQDHLDRFPNCLFAKLAKAKIEELKQALAAKRNEDAQAKKQADVRRDNQDETGATIRMRLAPGVG